MIEINCPHCHKFLFEIESNGMAVGVWAYCRGCKRKSKITFVTAKGLFEPLTSLKNENTIVV